MTEYVERVDYHARIRVRFDGPPSVVSWFVAQLEYNPRPWTDAEWYTVARFDHQPHLQHGHDVYDEGLHLDFYYRNNGKRTVYLDHGALPPETGVVLELCKLTLRDEYSRLIQIHQSDGVK